MPTQPSAMRPGKTILGAKPRKRVLILALAVVLIMFLATLPWQIRNWREAGALRLDASRQQARLHHLQQAHDALSHAQDALRAAPDDPNARLTLAAQLLQSRDFPGAAAQLRALEPAVRRSPDLAGAAAELYQKIGYLDRAVALARQAVRLAPDSPFASLRLGVLDMQIGWQTQGQALLNRAAQAMPTAAEPHLALALAANQSGAYKDAEQELILANRLRPEDWHILALLADNQSVQGRDSDARQTLTNALRLAPQEPSLYAQQARLLLGQARTQTAVGGRFDIAPIVAAARQCLALDPANYGAHGTLGFAYSDYGDPTSARREWEQAYALDPSDQMLAYNLGRLRVQQGDRATGLRLLAAAAQESQDDDVYNRLVGQAGLYPQNPVFHRQLARWCQAHHRLPRAIFEWQEVLAHLPKDAEAQHEVAQLRAERG